MLTFLRTRNDGLAALSAEMDRLVSDLAQPATAWSYSLAPAADVLETDADYRVVLDLPGLEPSKLQIGLENGTLSVKAERKQPETAQGTAVHRSERSFGTFFRSFSLPKIVDAARVEARYEQGVLTVVLPKREEAKPRSIAVTVK